MPIAEGVEAFLFDCGGKGVMVLWDRGTTKGVKPLPLNLGANAARVDLWGNVTPLLRSADDKQAGQVQLELGPMPILLVDIDGQLAQLRASVGFDRPLLESSFKPHTRKLQFTNPYRTAISGTVKLKAPAGWTINPPTMTFTLNPGETLRSRSDHRVPLQQLCRAQDDPGRVSGAGRPQLQLHRAHPA